MFLTYNGINLAMTSIDRVHRDTIFSDDGTTVLYIEQTVSVSGIYHRPVGGLPDLSGISLKGGTRNAARRSNIPSPPWRSVRGDDPDGSFGASALLRPFNQADQRVNDPDEIMDPASVPAGTPGNTLQSEFTQPPKALIVTPQSTGPNPQLPNSCSLPDPGSSGWAGPINTDRELELLLRTPRKKLIVWAFDENGQPLVWIESPRRYAPSDAKHGPVCLNCTVEAGPNGNSFFVSIDLRTWLTPCEDGSDRPLLSHRWHMVHVPDEDHYLTRIVKGQAVFDVGNMHEKHQNPDWFRKQLFHPIPLGFQRKLGPVDLSPDGSTLSYEYSDTDTTCVFDASDTGATRIDIQEYVKYTNPWRGLS